MKKYSSFADLLQDYPGPVKMIEQENDYQYPNAVFVSAAVGHYCNDEGEDIIVLFDVGIEGHLLFCWVSGDLSDPEPNRGSYIEDYYLMLTNEANKELDMIQ